MKLKVNRGTLLAVMECMAVRDVRYYINGICFLPDGKVAGTNGHMLAYGHHDNEITDQVILSVGKLPTKSFEYAVFTSMKKLINDIAHGVLLRRLSGKNLIFRKPMPEVDNHD